MNELILNQAPVWHWSIGGAIIATVIIVLRLGFGYTFGLSSGLENMCSYISRAEFFKRPAARKGIEWRGWFVAGTLLGGLLSSQLTGGFSWTWDMGMFDQNISSAPWIKALWVFAGGLLVGFGTRLGSGCTSGHGIFGVASLVRTSWIATAVFLGTGIATANLVYRVIFA